MDRKIVVAAVVVFLLAGGAWLSRRHTPSSTVPTAPPEAARGLAAIHAVARYEGHAAAPRPLSMASDSFCGRTPAVDESLLVRDGRVANVMVRVVKGASGPFAPAAPAILSQHGCLYRPRVLGLLAGSELVIRSDDDTTHNVHTWKGEESVFNRAQTKGSFTRTSADLKESDGVVTFKCDIHPWMTGYVVVSPNPYFAVTGSDGSATIALPEGRYTLEAWHETLGTSTQDVTVGGAGLAEVEFRFPSK